MDPLDQYADIQPLVKKEIDDAIAKYAAQAKFNVAQIPAHQHTGVDSSRIDYSNIIGTPTIPGGVNTKTGTGTAPAGVGTQVITTGFTSKLIKINAYYDVVGCHGMTIGSATTISDSHCLGFYHFGTTLVYESFNNNATNIIDILDTSGNTAILANISAISATTFTINWATTNASCFYNWEAIG